MIDIHCHLLPGIDDGPADLSHAMALARQAVQDGVTHSIVTPHIHFGRWENSKAGIRAAVMQFRQALADEKIPLTVGFAAEVRVCAELLTMVPEDQVPYLGNWGGQRVLLLEMPHSRVLPGMEQIVTWLIERGVRPMIAHPERNKDVMRKLSKLTPLIDLGCLFQITAGSLVGQFGGLAQERAVNLLEMGVVTALASDAHHADRRPVNLSEGREAAAKIIGAQKASELVYDNPLRIVGGQFTVTSNHGVGRVNYL